MESLLKSPMKLVVLVAWMSSLLDPCRFSNICDTCHTNATCKTINGSDGCFCKNGFTGNGRTVCKDDDECKNATQFCGELANCTNTVGSYFCTCTSGYTSTGRKDFLPNDGTQCHDIDECTTSSPCGGFAECYNTKGSFDCFCKKGYLPSTGKLFFHPKDGTVCTENPKKNCHLNSTCVTETINKTLELISSIKEPLYLLEEISKQTSGDLSPVDMISYIEVLSQSVSSLSVMNDNVTDKEALTNTTIKTFVNTVNNLVEKDELEVWNQLDQEDRKKSVTKLLHTVEQATLSISQNFQKNTQMEVNASDIALKLYTFESHQINHVHPHAYIDGDVIRIIPKQNKTVGSNGDIAIVFLRYDSIGFLLKPNDISEEMDDSLAKEPDDFTLNSQVIAGAINTIPPKIYQLDRVTFTLKHVWPVNQDVETKCAFWRYSVDNMKGHWSTEGCERTHFNTSHTGCKCNHLTHFAILMSSGRSDLKAHYNILTRITQLGIILSLICLSMCIFTFWFFSEIQSTRTTIHKNLCCSLFLAEFIFLVGINMNSNKLLCSIIAGLLHYFFLSAFAWMCIEGIHLYLIVVGVIYNKGFLHQNFYIFGYGSPAVVVTFSATMGYKYYGTNNVCWLSTENNFIWSFIGPACLIILVNLLAFGVIIYKVFRHTAVKKPEVSYYENIRSCARGALALLFLLGATWTFGVLHVVHDSAITAYLFTISNAFQGMFIFIFLCVLSRKIQEEYYRLFKNVPCCFECLR
ncbi:adhesion G protein-coupled receptor L4-like [Acipenser oxyrinchus oxyrinchus]|uniref:Adhesion G protein-coupled receptor L4 n=1 Tax=Acipenser oxyrinchus oxyrinchus TaxID=40147 RepID=A0AAD8G543_ACIOX|nr:adhesion G protein-coupled receptor L4-like [Acipenser oxyrinchus oxyrinchus]